MKLKNIAYAALIACTAAAIVIGSAVPSEAKAKKKAAAAPQKSAICSTARAPVCATRGSLKFT